MQQSPSDDNLSSRARSLRGYMVLVLAHPGGRRRRRHCARNPTV